jgi:hypothetical protein
MASNNGDDGIDDGIDDVIDDVIDDSVDDDTEPTLLESFETWMFGGSTESIVVWVISGILVVFLFWKVRVTIKI